MSAAQDIARQLLEGISPSDSDHPSILHFSLNRAATQQVKSILSQAATHNGLTHADLNGLSFNSDLPFTHDPDGESTWGGAFHDAGYLYSVLPGFIDYPQGDFIKILTVRDPRDVLVSRYFSWTASHELPPEGTARRVRFSTRRQQAQAQSIDEFVLDNVSRIKASLLDYMQQQVPTLKYEDMILHPESWLKLLLDLSELEVTPELRASLLSEIHLRPDAEDPMQHKRKGAIGDHLEKLTSDTIDKLNHELEEILSFYGYPTN
jgi:hypothetical protein